MKKLYFTTIALLFLAVGQAQIVNIPDANFKDYLLSSSSTNMIASTETPDINGLVSNYIEIDINNDGEIQLSEAQNIKYLDISFIYLSNAVGLEFFINLESLNLHQNEIISLELNSLINLKNLNCSYNLLTNLDVSSLTSLNTLNCSGNQLSSLDLSGLTNLYTLDCAYNLILDINLTGLINLKKLNCNDNQISSLILNNFVNLQTLECSQNLLTSIDLNELSNLEILTCSGNTLTTIDLSDLINLQTLYCNSNQLTSLNLSGLTDLTNLSCSNNLLPNLNLSGLTNLETLYCNNNQLPSINLSGLINLQYLNCSSNQLLSLNLNGLTNLLYLNCSINQSPNLNLSEVTNLLSLDCSGNQMMSLDVSGLINLKFLYCRGNLFPNLVVNGMANLQILDCSYNQLTSLNLSGLTSLQELYCSANQLTTFDVSDLSSLIKLNCSSNQFQNLNLNSLTNLQNLKCTHTPLTNLDVSNLTNLQDLNCCCNHLTTLNVSNLRKLQSLSCSLNQFTSLFIKNNNSYWSTLDFEGNPNLTSNLAYICANEKDLALVQTKLNTYGYTNCNVNSYCSFNPGGDFYTINGKSKIDNNNNGCDVSDPVYPNLKFNITDGLTSSILISNGSGNYSIPVGSGTYTITPLLENLVDFTVSPTSVSVTFPSNSIPFIQDFCVANSNLHHDLEVVVIPIGVARPGFDVVYKIKYKNKGNLSENASLNFNYNDAILDYVSATVAPSSQATGTLSWAIGTLAPFQSGEIMVTLNVNSPTETPPVNGGTILSYTATCNGLNTDETPEDNTFTLSQVVVNSFDPNDKTCLEGTTINPSAIGKYVHYRIRFENTGTFAAQNIVVKDMIDTAKFDVSSLQMTDASHECVTRITNPNKVEFIFENINLPFDDANNDGYVVFKIKTKPTLTTGSTISNSANIYFDYNFPIVTNTATSTFSTLQNDSFVFENYFSIYPNPVGDLLSINAKQDTEIYSLSIYNLLGQQVQTTTNPNKNVDVSGLKTGNYIVKVITEKGISSGKFIKQ